MPRRHARCPRRRLGSSVELSLKSGLADLILRELLLTHVVTILVSIAGSANAQQPNCKEEYENYEKSLEVAVGFHGQVEPNAIGGGYEACPNETDLIAFSNGIRLAVKEATQGQMDLANGDEPNQASMEQLNDQQAEQNVVALAAQAGCEKLPGGTTGTVIDADNRLDVSKLDDQNVKVQLDKK